MGTPENPALVSQWMRKKLLCQNFGGYIYIYQYIQCILMYINWYTYIYIYTYIHTYIDIYINHKPMHAWCNPQVVTCMHSPSCAWASPFFVNICALCTGRRSVFQHTSTKIKRIGNRRPKLLDYLFSDDHAHSEFYLVFSIFHCSHINKRRSHWSRSLDNIKKEKKYNREKNSSVKIKRFYIPEI